MNGMCFAELYFVQFLSKPMKTVVIIDDQYTMRVILAQVIENIDLGEEITVVSFSDGEAAYQWLMFNESDLIIIDYMMHTMSGHELLKILKSNHITKDVPVVSITSDDDICIRYQLLEDGAIDFMLKPLDYQECMLRFRNLLKLPLSRAAVAQEEEILPLCVLKSKAA